MAKPLSSDLRLRIILAVEDEGMSRRGAAVRFGVARRQRSREALLHPQPAHIPSKDFDRRHKRKQQPCRAPVCTENQIREYWW
jgi:hypothetical protein